MTLTQAFFISLLSSGTVGVLVVAFSNFLASRSNEHLRGELARDLESTRNVFELERKNLQAVLDKRHFVSRARFDAEFLAMKEIHEGASKVQLALNAVRPSLDYGVQNETEDEFITRIRERVRVLASAHDALLASQENQRPFYSDELYLVVCECSRLARTEASQAGGSRKQDGVNWYLQGSENTASYAKSYAKLLDLIRERMNVLEII